ncbi:MAG: hypothetical protein ACFB01_01075 [Cohaesibacteraceae bacterium]
MTRTTFRLAGYAMGLGAALVVGGALLPSPTGPWSAGPALSQSVYTAVLVNDAPITNYEINARAALLQVQGLGSSRAQSMAEEELINEALQRAEAQRLGISISLAELDSAVQTIASRSGLSISQLGQALRQRGSDLASLRQSIESQILWSEVVSARFRATVRVEEQDVIAALSGRTEGGENEPLTATEYTIREIIFVVPQGTSADQRLREASAFRSRFESCATGISSARQLTGVVVQDEIRQFSSEVSPALASALDETSVGQLTAPQAGESGVTMFAVCNKREVRSDADARRDIEDELRQEEGALLSRGYLRDLRASATIIRPER